MNELQAQEELNLNKNYTRAIKLLKSNNFQDGNVCQLLKDI